jgi:hypothetical protein
MLEGFQKIANRIAQGLVIAAMIVAAALLLQVSPTGSSARILGYPALPMILFTAAAAGGLVLTVDILRHDRHRRKRRP